jgi:hypothetical protein
MYICSRECCRENILASLEYSPNHSSKNLPNFQQLPWHFQPGIILLSNPVGFPYISSDKPAEKSFEQDGHINTDAVPLKITLAIAHECLKVLTKSKKSCIPRVCDMQSIFL